jgi:hypothetical protein
MRSRPTPGVVGGRLANGPDAGRLSGAVGGKESEGAGGEVGEELVVGEQRTWSRVGIDEAGLFGEREQGQAETEAGPVRPELWGQVGDERCEVAGTSGEAGRELEGGAFVEAGVVGGLVEHPQVAASTYIVEEADKGSQHGIKCGGRIDGAGLLEFVEQGVSLGVQVEGPPFEHGANQVVAVTEVVGDGGVVAVASGRGDGPGRGSVNAAFVKEPFGGVDELASPVPGDREVVVTHGAYFYRLPA